MWLLKFYRLYKTRIIIAIAIAAVLSVAGAVKFYGDTKYREGRDTCVSAQKSAVIATLQTDNQIWKEVRDENRKITDPVAAAAALDILRPDDLR